MSREAERVRKKLEEDPVVECNKIQKKFYPELFKRFADVKDPRNQSYTEYSAKVMLGTLYYKGIGGISSMQKMTRKFNDEITVENLYSFMGDPGKNIFRMVLPKMNFGKDWIRRTLRKYKKRLLIP